MNNAVFKKAIINVIGITGVAALSGALQAASFDCAKAAAPIEKLICSDETTSKLDADLAVAYKAAMEKADNKDALKQQQRTWLKEKRNLCKDADCLKQSYQLRIDELTHSSTSVADNKGSVKTEIEAPDKKFITFTLVEGDGYPLCKEYVEMLNKTQYTEIPACNRKILPEFKNFQEIAWVEMTNKEEMIKISKERAEIQAALNPAASKQTFSPHIKIKLINEDKLKVFLYKIDLNKDDIDEVIYRYFTNSTYDYAKYGYCGTNNTYYVDDSTISLDSIKPSSSDPYRVFNFNGSSELFIYGRNLYVSSYKGKTYRHTNLDVYAVDNNKICAIVAK